MSHFFIYEESFLHIWSRAKYIVWNKRCEQAVSIARKHGQEWHFYKAGVVYT